MPQKKKIISAGFLKKQQLLQPTIPLPYFLPSSASGKSGSTAPNNCIVMGCVGTGKQGKYALGNFLQLPDALVVALCDRRNG